MTLFRLSTLALSISLILSGCGGSKDEGTTTTEVLPTTTTLTGVVADGAIKGATVCLDKNNNLQCDSTEPQSVTNDKGEYTLKEINGEDALNYAVVAFVPVGAIDQDNPTTPISKSFTLTSPIGKHSFISPLTTLVATEMYYNPQLHAEEAAQNVNSLVGYNLQGILLFGNYLSSSTVNEALKVEAKKVLNNYLNFMSAIQSLPNYTANDFKAAHYLANKKFLRSITDKAFDGSSLANETELELAKRSINSVSAINIIKDTLIHSLIDKTPACNSTPEQCSSFPNSIIYTNKDLDNTSYEAYSLSTQNTQAINTNTINAEMKEPTSNGWTTPTIPQTFFGQKYYEIDASGLAVKSIVHLEKNPKTSLAQLNFNSNTFSANAKIFLLEEHSTGIYYQLFDTIPYNGVFNPLFMTNINSVAYKTISEFNNDCRSRFCYLYTRHTATQSYDIKIKIQDDGTLEVLSENTNNPNDSSIAVKGSWKDQIVNSQNIRIFTLDNDINIYNPSSLFITEYNNQVILGNVTPSNALKIRYFLNDTALNDFKAALN